MITVTMTRIQFCKYGQKNKMLSRVNHHDHAKSVWLVDMPAIPLSAALYVSQLSKFWEQNYKQRHAPSEKCDLKLGLSHF